MRVDFLAIPETAVITTASRANDVLTDDPHDGSTTVRRVRDEQRHKDNTARLYAWRGASHDLAAARANGASPRVLCEFEKTRSEAARALFEPNLPWAYKMSKVFTGVPTSHELDYRQAAALGLIEAAKSWDPGRSTLPTFSRSYIRGEILKAVRLAEHSLLSKDDFDMRPVVRLAMDEHIAQFHTTPSNQQVADATGLEVDQVHRIRTAYVVGTDTVIGGDDPFARDACDATVVDCSPTEDAIIPHVLSKDQIRDMATRALSFLPAREAAVLTLGWGLGGTAKLSLNEIGATLSMGREHARRLQDRAIARIKPILADMVAEATAVTA
jgi:RNA polymerase sigma factor (sigma-70 family)